MPVGGVDYTVEFVDSLGEVVEQRVVTSDNCTNGTCSILIPTGTCLGIVQATTSHFGNSTSVPINIGVPGNYKSPVFLSIYLISAIKNRLFSCW